MYNPGEIYDEPEHVELEESEHPHEMSKDQKRIAWVLALVFLLTIGLWFYKLNRSIHDPFVYKGDDASVKVQSNSGVTNLSDEELKKKDTDNDGLSDYDELNIYETSPYIEDSDSDGFNDKEEVDTNNDPNCQDGRDCVNASGLLNADAAAASQSGGVASSSAGIFDAAGGVDYSNFVNIGSSTASSSFDNAALGLIVGGAADAASLRGILLSAGMDKAKLDLISDEQLMKTYSEILADKK